MILQLILEQQRDNAPLQVCAAVADLIRFAHAAQYVARFWLSWRLDGGFSICRAIQWCTVYAGGQALKL